MLLAEKSTERNWKPIIAQLTAVVGIKGIIQRREELITYECDGLTSYRERPALVILPKTTAQIASRSQSKFAMKIMSPGLRGVRELGYRVARYPSKIAC